MLLLFSCNQDKEVEIQNQLSVSIDVFDVVKDFKEDSNNKDLFRDGVLVMKDYHVRIQLYIYNNEGILVSENIKIVDDFAQKVNIIAVLPVGTYTIVASADVVKTENDQIKFEYWSFDKTSDIRIFKITDLNFVGSIYKAIGVYKNTLMIDKPESLDIKVKPIGSLVSFRFRYNENANRFSTIKFIWDKTNDYYSVDEGDPNILHRQGNYEILEVNPEYYSEVWDVYFLSIQNQIMTWEANSTSGEAVNNGVVTFDIEQGINLVVETDVITGNYTIRNN
jgi:hypothetical protein